MLQLKSKAALAQEATTLAESFRLVYYRNNLYAPVHYLTEEPNPGGDPEETCWEILTPHDIQRIAAQKFQTMFASDSELRAFYFMTTQASEGIYHTVDSLLVKTDQGLRILDETGSLVKPTGEFVANTLQPTLNTDEGLKKEVFDTMVTWLGSEEEAVSLLHHLATALAPGWSAVKYVLLIGEGRNGKGVLIGMVNRLFGSHNISSVPRQEIAKRTPMVIELNGKLINLIYDGAMEYIKDSGPEKTLTAGEPASIKDLYVSAPVTVQTNALFVEALNREPLSRDKSPALQKRLARFYFDKVFPVDNAFSKRMWSPELVGAFLALLIDYYVQEHEIAEKLALTEASQALQLEHMYLNSHGLQFLKAMHDEGQLPGAGDLLDDVGKKFISWQKLTSGSTWELPEVTQQLATIFTVERKSKRVGGTVKKVKVVTGFKPDTQRYLDTLEGGLDEDSIDRMVGD